MKEFFNTLNYLKINNIKLSGSIFLEFIWAVFHWPFHAALVRIFSCKAEILEQYDWHQLSTSVCDIIHKKVCIYIYIVRYIYRSVSYTYSTVSLDLLSDLSRDRHRDISSVSWLRLIYFGSSIEIPPVEFYKIVSKWMTYL